MQTVPPLTITEIADFANAGDCEATNLSIMRELDRVATAAGEAMDSDEKLKCLKDAYAQPGFCELTQMACRPLHVCPRCTPFHLVRTRVAPPPLLPCTHAHPVETVQRMR
jgi:hypothetical protein